MSLASRAVTAYLWVTGAFLVLQGTGSLVLRYTGHDDPSLTHGFVHADNLHAAIHIVWGLTMLEIVGRPSTEPRRAALALIFGVFYTGLAFLGTRVYHPLGLDLGPFENGFHFIVGPLALVLGLWAWRATHAGRLTGRPPLTPRTVL
jgi:hypothetical protein